MESRELYSNQHEAVEKLRSGSILCGKTGSGKTITALFFYKIYYPNLELYVITTAKKRDTKDWEEEASLIGIDNIVVDSWNKICDYTNNTGKFFIFDEQRVSGYSKWAKSFIKIARRNKWILLSATPGDVWMDYISVFVANGFYRNKSDFLNQHVEYYPFSNYPKIKRYHNISKLERLRNTILVKMYPNRITHRNRKYHYCEFDDVLYSDTLSNRWHIYENHPIENPSQMTQVARRIVNESDDRQRCLKEILENNDRVIIFYNYNYELDLILNVCKTVDKDFDISQWNGKIHDELPQSDKWVYIVHYYSAEGWNCTTSNTIVFYSLNYSYKIMEQAEGRIDRPASKNANSDLFYHYLVSASSIDRSIMRALSLKRKFNEVAWGEKC